MISSISIENIALIDNVEIEFHQGLNVLSGETGAGKSIIIDSINFVLGERADKGLIRHGENYARVEMTFDTNNPNALKILEDLGFEPDSTIVVTRKMSIDGKSECRINRKICPLQSLKLLVSNLVDLHAQHEHQSLLNPALHIKLLDSYGKYQKEIDDFKSDYNAYLSTKKMLASYPNKIERERQIDVLKYETSEIEKAEIKDGEEDSLLTQRTKLNNMERILSATESAISSIDDGETGAILSISSCISYLKNLVSFDESMESIISRLNDVKIELSDIEDTLKSSIDESNYEQGNLETVEKRLSLIRSIKRKYGPTIEDVNNYYDQSISQLKKLENAETEIEKLEILLSKLSKQLIQKSQNIYKLRQNAAKQLEKSIVDNLNDLGMKNTSFVIDIRHDDDPDKFSCDGGDSVEFMISPNIGEPLKPLSKIASGGELSRFMLALKNIISDIDEVDTLIFDEIDTGISGNVAQAVGIKLYSIAMHHQVIAVTHLPQIAVMGDVNYLIKKSTEQDRTTTEVFLLDNHNLINEIVRLMGGSSDSTASQTHAQELRAWADEKKRLMQNITTNN